jgi:hypothetical protein
MPIDGESSVLVCDGVGAQVVDFREFVIALWNYCTRESYYLANHGELL